MNKRSLIETPEGPRITHNEPIRTSPEQSFIIVNNFLSLIVTEYDTCFHITTGSRCSSGT